MNASSDAVTRNRLPLPVPWIVRNGVGWTAFLFVLAIPLGFLGLLPAQWLLNLMGPSFPSTFPAISRAMTLMFAVPLSLCPFWAGLIPAFRRTSSFILECVRWYLDHDDVESAKGLARVLGYQVWYWDWKRNPWFRRFVVENGLLEESARFAKFHRRLPAG